MDGLQGWQKELPMFTMNTAKDLEHWVIGCDKDIGGTFSIDDDFAS